MSKSIPLMIFKVRFSIGIKINASIKEPTPETIGYTMKLTIPKLDMERRPNTPKDEESKLKTSLAKDSAIISKTNITKKL